MAGAFTTLKISPEDHQAILALLRYLAAKITDGQFRAILMAQGRKIPDDIATDRVVPVIADQLIGAIL